MPLKQREQAAPPDHEAFNLDPQTLNLNYAFEPPLKNRASKARGSSSLIEHSCVSPLRLARTMCAFLQNSWMICRQVPHGGVNVLVSATMASSAKSRSPSDRAFQIATRSAQTVNP